MHIILIPTSTNDSGRRKMQAKIMERIPYFNFFYLTSLLSSYTTVAVLYTQGILSDK
jgi:hypothetical protein